MKGQSLKQLWESLGPAECTGLLAEGLKTKKLRPSDFSLRELAEAFCGNNWVQRLQEQNVQRFGARPILEAGEGVDVSAFSNITGQLFFNKIEEGWENATLVSDRLMERIPTKLDGEKIPWLSHVVEEGKPIRPGEPYPEAHFGERYITTPNTTKNGMIVSVTKEAIFFDLTGQMLRRAEEVGYKLGYNKEKLCLDTILGIINTYNLNGTANNTYQTSAGSNPFNWVNELSGTPLVDWTSINQAVILFSQILDPDTGNPIVVEPKQILVMPARLFTARRIVSATEVRSTFPGYGVSSPAPAAPGNVQMISANPLPPLEVYTSPIAYQRLIGPGGVNTTNADDYWFIGDFKKAFAYMENWPLTVQQAPAQNIKEFEQDIVVRYKASYRGYPAVLDPRFVAKFYNS